jgi:hypothetical protein
MKIRLLGTRLVPYARIAKGRTDMKQLIVTVLNFAEKPKKGDQSAASSRSDFNQFNNKVNGWVMKGRMDTACNVH